MSRIYDLESLRTLNRLVDQALALPHAERTTWVDSLGAEYEAFKPRLKAMLEAVEDEAVAGFLDAMPPIEVAPDDLVDPAASAPAAGHLVGAYRLVRPLGRGGQAEVWLGERARSLTVAVPRRRLRFGNYSSERCRLSKNSAKLLPTR